MFSKLCIRFRTTSLRAGLLAVCVASGGSIPLIAIAQTAAVPTMVVQPKLVSASYELDGVVQAVKQSTVSAQASGRIASALVKAGDRVRAGQVLLVIDDREAAIGVQKSQAQGSQAAAELLNAQAHVERTRDLHSKGFVSKAALDTAQAQFASTQALRDQATAAARQASLLQGFTQVRAPYDGWVLQMHAEAGDLAVPGAPLVTMYAPQPLRAVVQVSGSRAHMVRSAEQVAVQIDDLSGHAQWVAPVTRSVVPFADPVSQTTEWRFELPAKESAALLPGQQVRVRFAQAQSGQASKLIVPSVAIVRRGELTAVYIASAHGFALRAVRLGSAQGADGWEVLAGIVAGDAVALDPIRAGFEMKKP